VEHLSALFPAAASFSVAPMDMTAPLWPEEEALIGHAVEKRRREFALGRMAARKALAKLNVEPLAILMQADRRPIWPAGFVGSITHCNGFCGAVVARDGDMRSIGFDAEPALQLPDGVDRMIYGEEEAAHFSALPRIVNWPKLAFSAKEAFYKCFYPATQKRLGFREARVHFTADGGFTITSDIAASFLDDDVQGRWLMRDGLVFTSFVKI
jgi:4'-phosphopantetheinyl transferase EntD